MCNLSIRKLAAVLTVGVLLCATTASAMIIDSIGVPSLVPAEVSDVPAIEHNGVYLSAADPNPFNRRTRFRFGLTETGKVDVAEVGSLP